MKPPIVSGIRQELKVAFQFFENAKEIVINVLII
jgi:hypothetical protein